ncbi:hypothetical protein BPAE_0094g00160 [Botrytis paeoniae]|uniref:Protein-tyrosine sulfotransferase n=1 Tax=Botrytis paeoniae TaxID=278948 RepID=A0A4Z1FSV4_9HELO|nr:hypothetical protein BPAE_0094g00160 [Botrytis paeoniae]
MPCVNFSDEMLTAFPNAKVVLTRREPVAWEGMGAVHETMRLAITDYNSSKPWTDGEALAAHVSKNIEHIRSVVPPEILLEFHPRDGWEILCRFLRKEVQKEPFPYINKGNFTANVFKLVLVLKTIKICGPYFMALGVGYLAWA